MLSKKLFLVLLFVNIFVTADCVRTRSMARKDLSSQDQQVEVETSGEETYPQQTQTFPAMRDLFDMIGKVMEDSNDEQDSDDEDDSSEQSFVLKRLAKLEERYDKKLEIVKFDSKFRRFIYGNSKIKNDLIELMQEVKKLKRLVYIEQKLNGNMPESTDELMQILWDAFDGKETNIVKVVSLQPILKRIGRLGESLRKSIGFDSFGEYVQKKLNTLIFCRIVVPILGIFLPVPSIIRSLFKILGSVFSLSRLMTMSFLFSIPGFVTSAKNMAKAMCGMRRMRRELMSAMAESGSET